VNVSFHAQASSELNDAIDFYERQRRGLGREFADEVKSAAQRIKDSPEAWTVVSTDEHLRRCRTHRFPYGLIYQLQNDRIVIFAVAHLRRRPGYWRDRL
jgi:toxin ParE1/3/4